ncbi:SDR family oxidoreductase [Halalkalibacter urbisdiaboli]|uniref:SDR family oxidoreductase n=1 Tax=Halalkalibacter urbisdiaboli TaxID=1960589 RepID=UPI000B441C59|nr:SDR family NAD(P)-dependent oxidoreductase [Halalkalibacter urbisdiaboli]
MTRTNSFTGKLAVVTGAGSGMGRAAAIQLANEGAKLALFDIKRENAEHTKQQIEKQGRSAFAFECDIASSQSVKAAINETVERFGQIDVLFANAGIAGEMAPIETMAVDDWEKTIQTNLTGTFLTVKHAIPSMKKKGGSIIITSSVSGNRVFSQAGFSAYSTTKAGQLAFMKMAALELARYKIRVNAICPGAIKTNIGQSLHSSPDVKNIEVPLSFPEGDQPLEHGPGTAQQVAELVSFLASEASSHITGTEVYIDGGESLLRG